MSGAPTSQEPTHHFIQIDEEGFLKMDDVRVTDIQIGRQWLSQLHIDERGRTIAQIGTGSAIVECFDEPYIALDIDRSNGMGSSSGNVSGHVSGHVSGRCLRDRRSDRRRHHPSQALTRRKLNWFTRQCRILHLNHAAGMAKLVRDDGFKRFGARRF